MTREFALKFNELIMSSDSILSYKKCDQIDGQRRKKHNNLSSLLIDILSEIASGWRTHLQTIYSEKKMYAQTATQITINSQNIYLLFITKINNLINWNKNGEQEYT